MEGESNRDREPRVFYTCWPCGPGGYTLCGALLVVFGGAILADTLLPGLSQTIWGAALLALGVWVLSRRRQEGERW